MRVWLELAHPIHSYPVAQRVIRLCNGPSGYASGQRLGIRTEHIHVLASIPGSLSYTTVIMYNFIALGLPFALSILTRSWIFSATMTSEPSART